MLNYNIRKIVSYITIGVFAFGAAYLVRPNVASAELKATVFSTNKELINYALATSGIKLPSSDLPHAATIKTDLKEREMYSISKLIKLVAESQREIQDERNDRLVALEKKPVKSIEDTKINEGELGLVDILGIR